jgi:luciferase family oxidoreductase group 1
MVPLSVLDLSPIIEGGDAGQALRNSLDLARHVEALGYQRFWMAEHHNLPGIASAATAVALAHVAAGTNTIRIGAGGIMLPNHAPLLIAEQFGTLAALHPGRVELGLGRAPGSDQVTARAVRRALLGGAENFPQDVVELMAYFRPAEPGQAVQAVPGAGLEVPIWILGSSLYGAQLALGGLSGPGCSLARSTANGGGCWVPPRASAVPKATEELTFGWISDVRSPPRQGTVELPRPHRLEAKSQAVPAWIAVSELTCPRDRYTY